MTKRYLVFGWAARSFSVKTSKEAAQRGSKHDNMMKQAEEKEATKHGGEIKKNTLAVSNYFYIEE